MRRVDFHAPQYGVLRRDDEIGSERELETAAGRLTAQSHHDRNAHRFNRTVGVGHLGDECAKPAVALAGPFVHRTADAEIRSFGVNEQRADVAVGGVLHRSDEVVVVLRAHEVERRAGQHNPAEAIFLLKSNSAH
nr:hypothetical protein [Nocardia miyunensis]